MAAHNLIRTSLMWNLWNLSAERLWRHSSDRYMRLRYEDFIARPQNAILRILEWMQETPPQLPLVNEREVELDTNHTVSGNPNRFRQGTTELRLDEEWKKKAPRSDQLLVALLTWPLLIKYGYWPLQRRDIATPDAPP